MDPHVKLLYGKPDSILLIEDLILSFSLSELINMFNESLISAKQKSPKSFNTLILIEALRNEAKYLFSEKLFLKWKMFTGNILREASKAYKSPLVLHDINLLPFCEEATVPYNLLFQSYLKQTDDKEY